MDTQALSKDTLYVPMLHTVATTRNVGVIENQIYIVYGARENCERTVFKNLRISRSEEENDK